MYCLARVTSPRRSVREGFGPPLSGGSTCNYTRAQDWPFEFQDEREPA
jgi:hypothetical protein